MFVLSRNSEQRSISVQFLGPEGGEGTSELTELFASFAADHLGAPVCLLSFDSRNNVSVEHFGRLHESTPISQPSAKAVDYSRAENGKTIVEPKDQQDDGNTAVAIVQRSEETGTASEVTRRLTAYIEQERSKVALLIVNSRPLGQSLESLLISRMVDGVILVLDADRTSAMKAVAARDKVTAAGAHLLGALLNKRHRYTPRLLASLFAGGKDNTSRRLGSPTRRLGQVLGSVLIALFLIGAGYDMVMNLGGPKAIQTALSERLGHWFSSTKGSSTPDKVTREPPSSSSPSDPSTPIDDRSSSGQVDSRVMPPPRLGESAAVPIERPTGNRYDR